EMQVALTLGFAGTKQTVGRGELGHDQATTGDFAGPGRISFTGRRHDGYRLLHKAGIANESAKDGVGHACHRGQNGSWGDAYITDLKRLRHLRAIGGDGWGYRSFPKLMHVSAIPTLNLRSAGMTALYMLPRTTWQVNKPRASSS